MLKFKWIIFCFICGSNICLANEKSYEFKYAESIWSLVLYSVFLFGLFFIWDVGLLLFLRKKNKSEVVIKFLNVHYRVKENEILSEKITFKLFENAIALVVWGVLFLFLKYTKSYPLLNIILFMIIPRKMLVAILPDINRSKIDLFLLLVILLLIYLSIGNIELMNSVQNVIKNF